MPTIHLPPDPSTRSSRALSVIALGASAALLGCASSGDPPPPLDTAASAFSSSLSLTVGSSYASGAGAFMWEIAGADLNGDGRSDLVMTTLGGTSGYMYRELSATGGGYSAPARYTNGGPLVLADFTGDGRPDVVTGTASTTSITLTVHRTTSSGKFSTTVTTVTLATLSGNQVETMWDMAAADLNGDGKRDLVVSADAAGLIGPVIYVLLGNGDGTFAAPVTYNRTSGSAYSLAVGDLNGDGRPDVVSLGGANDLSVMYNNGDGTLAPAIYVPAGTDVRAVSVGDFNGDGYPDLAATEYGGGGDNLSIVLNDGHGGFLAPTVTTGGHSAAKLKAVDLNGDHVLDLVSTGYDYYDDVAIRLGHGDGTFAPPVLYPVNGHIPWGLGFGDTDGDGKLDLLVTDVSFGYHVYPGHGDGTFGAPADKPLGLGASSLAAGDFNGDGYPDVALASAGTDNVSVFLGGSGGALAAPVNYASRQLGGVVLSGDFDNDGVLDLAATQSSDNASFSYFRGAGGGTFSPAAQGPSTTLTSLSAMTTGDINGDGNLDIVGATGSLFTVFAGHGDGTFTEGPFFVTPVHARAYSVAVADFNLDGKLDVVMASSVGDHATVFLGNGDGTFQAGVGRSASGQTSPYGVTTADLNGDGRPDFALANYGSGTVSVFLGNGDGTFQTAVVYTASSGARGIVAADVNHDGVLDLAVTCSTNSKLSVLVGRGDGTFQAAVSYGVGAGPRAIVSADFNHDNKADLAVASYTSNDVTLVFNTSP